MLINENAEHEHIPDYTSRFALFESPHRRSPSLGKMRFNLIVRDSRTRIV